MAKKKEKVDDLAIPPFLKRKPNKEAVDRIIKRDASGMRDWIMPQMKLNQGESDMAKKTKEKAQKGSAPKVECADANLPVEVNVTLANGKTEQRNFDNMVGFIEWFDGKTMELEGSIADAKVTMVSVKEKVTEKAAKAAAAAAPPPPKGKGKAAATPAPAAAKTSKPRGVGFVRHGVKVGTKEYKSAWQAFQELKLGSASECVKFRTLLKNSKAGKETYEKDGKKYIFELVEKAG